LEPKNIIDESASPRFVELAGSVRNNLVNLDALILRDDFAEVRSSPEPPPFRLPEALRLADLVSDEICTALRKPHYQRETSCWSSWVIAEYVRSFIDGDLIPAVILWCSPTTGKIFIVDGSHRLSALVAWTRDDYGDNGTSLAFFGNRISPEQFEMAQKTRSLIENLIGSYEMLRSAGTDPESYDPATVKRARNADTLPIPILWMAGNTVTSQTEQRNPKRLARKLLDIRKGLNISQQDMASLLGLRTSHKSVSGFERGTREPDLLVLLKYACLARITFQELVNDTMSPAK
jgi:DNA-binding XRE family transcriptional regulator